MFATTQKRASRDIHRGGHALSFSLGPFGFSLSINPYNGGVFVPGARLEIDLSHIDPNLQDIEVQLARSNNLLTFAGSTPRLIHPQYNLQPNTPYPISCGLYRQSTASGTETIVCEMVRYRTSGWPNWASWQKPPSGNSIALTV